MRRLIMLTGMAVLALAASVQAATLNKCIDAQSKVTYSNLPCRNAQEAHKLEIEPSPLPEPARAQPSRTQSTQSQPAQSQNAQPEAERPSKGNTSSKPVAGSSARECDSLSSKLGSVLDKMDKAHRKGYSQAEMDKWNQEVKNLESKKQQSGCF